MRGIQLLKCMSLAVMAFAVAVARGDMPRPSYHALSRSAWEARQREISTLVFRHKIVETIHKVTCGHEIIVLLAICVLSLFGVTTCVSFSPRVKTSVLICFLIIIFVSLGLMYLVFSNDGTMAVAGSPEPLHLQSIRDDITVEPIAGETYEEYLKRVDERENPTCRCDGCGVESSSIHRIGGVRLCHECWRSHEESQRDMK